MIWLIAIWQGCTWITAQYRSHITGTSLPSDHIHSHISASVWAASPTHTEITAPSNSLMSFCTVESLKRLPMRRFTSNKVCVGLMVAWSCGPGTQPCSVTVASLEKSETPCQWKNFDTTWWSHDFRNFQKLLSLENWLYIIETFAWIIPCQNAFTIKVIQFLHKFMGEYAGFLTMWNA